MNPDKIWTCKDGRKVAISKMTDSHLVNTINMLHRLAPSMVQRDLVAGSRVLMMVTGEFAQEAIERDLDMIMESTLEDYLDRIPQYDYLIKEADKRKLKYNEVPV